MKLMKQINELKTRFELKFFVKPRYAHTMHYPRIVGQWIFYALEREWAKGTCRNCGELIAPRVPGLGTISTADWKLLLETYHIQPAVHGPKYDEGYSRNNVVIYYTCHKCMSPSDDVFLWNTPEAIRMVYTHWKQKNRKDILRGIFK